MNNISFGQYVPGNSWIYKLDPRLKIIFTILMIVMIFLIPTLELMIVALIVFLLIFLTTRISLIKVLNGIKGVLFLMLFTVFMQLGYTKGDSSTLLYTFNMSFGLYQLLFIIGSIFVYFFTKKYIPFKFLYLLLVIFVIFMLLWNSPFKKFEWFYIGKFNWNSFKFKVYQEGVDRAGFILIRILLMIGTTSLLTLSTMTTDINNGLEAVLSPLKIIKIPVGVFSMLISLTLRFIPTLMNESRKIMNAQASRGVDFNEGSIKQKVNQIISLLIPMFVISFKRAEDLSNAMEARGYVIGQKRTKLDLLKLRWRDYVSIVVVISLFTLIILSRIYNVDLGLINY
ncbi:MAG: energy-coupling factor transporter transmembrane protein EcfT [Acholeplasmatales bacterium]|nr:energy-coupling factor transporter transmembrane protein EcfT [Acholeplasmatales bacterium]